MITVKFFTLLRLYLGIDELQIEVEQSDVRSLLPRVAEELGNNLVIEKLLDETGALLTGTIILINGHDIFDLQQLDSMVHKGDSVSLFTPGGGG